MRKSDIAEQLKGLLPNLEDLELLARAVSDSERRGYRREGRESEVEARTVCGRGIQLGDLEVWRPIARSGGSNVTDVRAGRRLILMKDRQLVEQNMVLFEYADGRYEWWAGRDGRGSTTPITWEDALDGWGADELAGALADVLELARERRRKTVESLERRREGALRLRAQVLADGRQVQHDQLLRRTPSA